MYLFVISPITTQHLMTIFSMPKEVISLNVPVKHPVNFFQMLNHEGGQGNLVYEWNWLGKISSCGAAKFPIPNMEHSEIYLPRYLALSFLSLLIHWCCVWLEPHAAPEPEKFFGLMFHSRALQKLDNQRQSFKIPNPFPLQLNHHFLQNTQDSNPNLGSQIFPLFTFLLSKGMAIKVIFCVVNQALTCSTKM